MKPVSNCLAVAFWVVFLVACESPEQQEARARASLDATLAQLEECARLVPAMVEASEAMEAAVPALDHPAFMAANAAFEESSNTFFSCLDGWKASAARALDETGLPDEIFVRVWSQWTDEHWQRLGLDRIFSNGGSNP